MHLSESLINDALQDAGEAWINGCTYRANLTYAGTEALKTLSRKPAFSCQKTSPRLLTR